MDTYPNTTKISPVEETLVQSFDSKDSFKIYGIGKDELNQQWNLVYATRSLNDSSVTVVLRCEADDIKKIQNDFERLTQKAKSSKLYVLPNSVRLKLKANSGASLLITPNYFELN